MRMYLISDNDDTLIGMRLAGINGVVVHEKDHLLKELDEVTSNSEISILIITEKLSKQFPEYIKDIKLNRKTPIIVEIPDRHGTGRSPNFITNYINEAIGVKLS